MPHLTMTEIFKATTKRWFSCLVRHPARESEWVCSATRAHMLAYLLPRPGRGRRREGIRALFVPVDGIL